MPTYAFQCEQCGHQFSTKLPFASKDYPPCEQCAAAVKKLMSPPLGIMFKGQGFYKTDNAKPAKTLDTSSVVPKKEQTPTQPSMAERENKNQKPLPVRSSQAEAGKTSSPHDTKQ